MELTSHSYGKSKVRLTKVVRNGPRHKLFEIEAAIELEGDFARAYTHGDNANCVATDSMKNTVYVLAKEHHFTTGRGVRLRLAEHFVATYPQVSRAAWSWRRPTAADRGQRAAARPRVHRRRRRRTRLARLGRGAARPSSGGAACATCGC
jgi:urate oxidase